MNRKSQQLLLRGLLLLFVILLILFSWNVIHLNILNETPSGVPLDVSRATLQINQLKESFAMEPIPIINLLPTPPITINQSMFKPNKYKSITIPPVIQ
jgi:hypothetical protein